MSSRARARYGLVPVVSPQAMERLRQAGCLDEIDAKIARCDREIEAAIAGSSPDHDAAQRALSHMGESPREDLRREREECQRS